MMKFRLLTLKLYCRRSVEIVDLSAQISFFHGQISSGKSSIVRLIDFCLGGDLERTPAIRKELVSAQLVAEIGEFQILFEREAEGSSNVTVTWRHDKKGVASVLAPISAAGDARPIWGDSVFCLSDLLFHMLGMTPPKVRKSKADADSPLVRLSFRDVFWYCCLHQDLLDSSFYNLEGDPFKKLKSRDVMRFLVGYYTERLGELESEMDECSRQEQAKREAGLQIRGFLDQFGLGTEKEIAADIESIDSQLRTSLEKRATLRASSSQQTHFADDLRVALRDLATVLATKEQTLQDLKERISEQEALRAELLAAKFRMVDAQTVSKVLSSAAFESCPNCGSSLTERMSRDDTCIVCGATISAEREMQVAEVIRKELDLRYQDLTESISRHREALTRQERDCSRLREKKGQLDRRLAEELEQYDSAYLSHAREIEQRVAALQERRDHLERLRAMPEAINNLEREASELAIRRNEIRLQIDKEKTGLIAADDTIRAIEQVYLDILLSTGVPGVYPSDTVEINRRTWIPMIMTGGDEALKWGFYGAGSGGKKTLLKVCYALAVHKVAVERALPLPPLVIIDTPMKNIGEDVNRDIFLAFYRSLYELAGGILRGTQFIMVDKEFVAPTSGDVTVSDRYMTPSDPKFPPLITYYRGP